MNVKLLLENTMQFYGTKYYGYQFLKIFVQDMGKHINDGYLITAGKSWQICKLKIA